MTDTNSKDEMSLEEVFAEAIKTFGERNQITMFFEEAAELQDLLAKHLRGRKVKREHIQEEIADVMLIVFQLMEMFGQKDVWLWFNYKMERLEKRIQKAKEKQQEEKQCE